MNGAVQKEEWESLAEQVREGEEEGRESGG